MKVTLSPSTGYYLAGGEDNQPARLLSAITMTQLDPLAERAGIALARDWIVLECNDLETGLIQAKKRALAAKSIALARLRIMVLSSEIGTALCAELESLIANYVSAEYILQELLIAPYSNPERIQLCAEDALSNGYGAAGHLFARLFDLQPLLRRFSTLWLSLSIDPFLNTDSSKQQLWNRLRTSGSTLKLLEAEDKDVFVEIFGALAFEEPIPRNRSGIARLGNELAGQLFGGGNRMHLAQEMYTDDSPDYRTNETKVRRDRGGLERALKEIDGIAAAVANGDDHLAIKYLRDLIDRQTADDSARDFAVKSLCNLAKQCADMLRSDFEAICLTRAREINPLDPWTLIQLGDHLKRVGRYDDARVSVERALNFGLSEVGQSLLADIDSQAGDYESAIALYQKIDNWQVSATIRTAIADNLRRLGRFEEAAGEYRTAESLGDQLHRSIAGRAEIAKLLGRMDEAAALYRSILRVTHKSDRAWWVYMITLAGILKQSGKYQEALGLAEEVIARVPFAMQARVLRASIWGLLDLEEQGLATLPEGKSLYAYGAYGEWVHEYTRGLLLLRTERYQDAQTRLIANLDTSVLESEERTVMRLAAALSLLADRNVERAKLLLGSIAPSRSALVRHLTLVLEYHLSVQQNDFVAAHKLYEALARRQNDNVLLWRATQAIRRGDVKAAVRSEVDLMLSLAA